MQKTTTAKPTVILFSSGFGGGAGSVLSEHAVRFFNLRGLLVVPMRFSDSKSDFSDLSLSTYRAAIGSVVAQVAEGTHIVFVGHSLGATIFLDYIASSGISDYSLVLLDPSMPEAFKPWFEAFMKLDAGGRAYTDAAHDLRISSDFHDELLSFDTIAAIKQLRRRVLVVVAERGAAEHGDAIKRGAENVEVHVVPATGHQFGRYAARVSVFSLISSFLSNMQTI